MQPSSFLYWSINLSGPKYAANYIVFFFPPVRRPSNLYFRWELHCLHIPITFSPQVTFWSWTILYCSLSLRVFFSLNFFRRRWRPWIFPAKSKDKFALLAAGEGRPPPLDLPLSSYGKRKRWYETDENVNKFFCCLNICNPSVPK